MTDLSKNKQKQIPVTCALLFFAFMVSGCMNTSTIMSSWKGKHIEELISSWGAPNSHVKLESGKTVYSWVSNWGSAYMMNTCRQSFTTGDDGIILSWRFAGCPQWQTNTSTKDWFKPDSDDN